MRPTPILFALTLSSLLSGCATVGAPGARPLAGADTLDFRKQDLTLSCGELTYDLLRAAPVRSERIGDLLTRETFTRRYFVVEVGGQRYALKTEQLEGQPYPRKILVETRRGFRRLLLDGEGNIVQADHANDLSD